MFVVVGFEELYKIGYWLDFLLVDIERLRGYIVVEIIFLRYFGYDSLKL